MLQKEQAKQTKEYLFDSPALINNRDEDEFRESRKRTSDNSLQIYRIMKCSRPSSNNDEAKLHGTPYFRKPGYIQEEMLDIADRNNYPKVNLPCYTFFLIEEVRQSHRGDGCDRKLMPYVDGNMLAQVNRIKDPTPVEIELAKDYSNESRFVLCTYPDYERETGKLLGIKEEIAMITVLGDPDCVFFDNGFGGKKNPSGRGAREIKCQTLLVLPCPPS